MAIRPTQTFSAKDLIDNIFDIPQKKTPEVILRINDTFADFLYAKGFDWIVIDKKTGKVNIEASEFVYKLSENGNLPIVMKDSMKKRRSWEWGFLGLNILDGEMFFTFKQIIEDSNTQFLAKGKKPISVKTRTDELIKTGGGQRSIFETYLASGRTTRSMGVFSGTKSVAKELSLKDYRIENPGSNISTEYNFKIDEIPGEIIWGFQGSRYRTGQNQLILAAQINLAHNEEINALAVIKTKAQYLQNSLVDGLNREEQKKLTEIQLQQFRQRLLAGDAIEVSDSMRDNSPDGNIASVVKYEQLDFGEVVQRTNHTRSLINEFSKVEGVALSDKEGGTNQHTFEVIQEQSGKWNKIQSYMKDDSTILTSIIFKAIKANLNALDIDIKTASKAREIFKTEENLNDNFIILPILKPAETINPQGDAQKTQIYSLISEFFTKKLLAEQLGIPLYVVYRMTKDVEPSITEHETEDSTTPNKELEVDKENMGGNPDSKGRPIKTPENSNNGSSE